MMISITSTLYSQNSSEGNGAAGISSSTPNPVSLAPGFPESVISPVPTDTTITPVATDILTTQVPENIPPGNSGVLIPDTVLVVTRGTCTSGFRIEFTLRHDRTEGSCGNNEPCFNTTYRRPAICRGVHHHLLAGWTECVPAFTHCFLHPSQSPPGDWL